MKKITMLFCAAVLLAASVWAGGRAFHRHHAMGGHHAMHQAIHQLTAGLNLTDEQKDTAREIHEEMMAKGRPLMEQQKALWTELHAALDVDRPNATEVGEKAIALHAGRKQVKALHEEGMARFSAILTPEQRATFEKNREGLRERRPGMGFPMDHEGF